MIGIEEGRSFVVIDSGVEVLYVVDVVASYLRTRLGSKGVDATSIAQLQHHVLDFVVQDVVVPRIGGLGVPAPPQRYAGVRQLLDIIVSDGGVHQIARKQPHAAAILYCNILDKVLVDSHMAIEFFGIPLIWKDTCEQCECCCECARGRDT